MCSVISTHSPCVPNSRQLGSKYLRGCCTHTRTKRKSVLDLSSVEVNDLLYATKRGIYFRNTLRRPLAHLMAVVNMKYFFPLHKINIKLLHSWLIYRF